MISVLIKSTLILLTAAVAAGLLLRRSSAAIRHLVWAAGLLAALAMPLSSLLLPSWSAVIPAPVASLLEAPSRIVFEVEESRAAGQQASEVAALPDAGRSGSRSALDLVLLVWIAGSAVGILLLLGGAIRLGWVAFRARPFDEPRWRALVQETAAALNLRRPVRLLQNRNASLLGTWGIFSARVLVPAGAEDWPEARIRMVLGHELAHVRRGDWPLQVLAEAARAIYWFNPLFWMVCSALRRESEHASDDAVVNLGMDGTAYAEELLELARALRGAGRRQPILAMAQPSHLEKRLKALLNPSLSRVAAAPWAALVVALVAVGLTLPLAAIRPAPPSAPEESAAIPAPPAVVSTPPPAPDRMAAISRVAALPVLPPSPNPAPESAPAEEAQNPAIEPGKEYRIEYKAHFVGAAGAGARDETPAACPVTPSVKDAPVDIFRTAPLGAGPWHVNEDRSIWVWDQPYTAGRATGTMWIRPAGAGIVISGRRLDAPAPALHAAISPEDPLASGLVFPTAGCWEITARAAGSMLTFVTEVAP